MVVVEVVVVDRQVGREVGWGGESLLVKSGRRANLLCRCGHRTIFVVVESCLPSNLRPQRALASEGDCPPRGCCIAMISTRFT